MRWSKMWKEKGKERVRQEDKKIWNESTSLV